MTDQSKKAFNHAIATGHLSTNAQDENYAGNYMFMREEAYSYFFKHINTRRYTEVSK